MHSFTKQLINFFSLVAFVVTGVLAPCFSVQAVAGPTSVSCSTADYTTANGSNPACTTVNVGGQLVSYPKLIYTPLSSVVVSPKSGFSNQLESGTATATSLNQTATLLGVSSSAVANIVTDLPVSSSVIYASLSPLNTELNIYILKIQKTREVVTVSQAPFTPQSGNIWAVSRTYMSPAARATPGPGINPYAQYDQGDATFHGVSLAQALPIAGAAMRYAQASMIVLSVANSSLSEHTNTSGPWYKKTTTTTVTGNVTPSWYIGQPQSMQPNGVSAAGCAIVSSATSPCPVYDIIPPYASYSLWSGGNLPQTATQDYQWSQTSSSWTVLAFTVLEVLGLFPIASTLAQLGNGSAIGLLSSFQGMEPEGYSFMSAGMPDSAALASGTGLNYVAPPAINGTFLSSQALSAGATIISQAPAVVAQGTQQIGLFAAEATIQNGSVPGQTGIGTFNAGYNQIVPALGVDYTFNELEYVQDTQATQSTLASPAN